MKMPRGVWPSTNRIAPAGRTLFVAHLVQRLLCRIGEVAEEAVVAAGAVVAVVDDIEAIGCIHVDLRRGKPLSFCGATAACTQATYVAGAGEQSARVCARVGVRTPSRRKQLPGSTRFLFLFPREVTAKQVKRIDFLRVSLRARLKIWIDQACRPGLGGLIDPRGAPSRSEIGVITGMRFGYRGWRIEELCKRTCVDPLISAGK
jgi:hypothetical protein